MQSASAGIVAGSSVYSRRARQIRARYAGQPARMHQALQGLAQRTDRLPWSAGREALRDPAGMTVREAGRRSPVPVRRPAAAVDAWVVDPSAVAGAVERGFAGHVAERLSAGAFTFSDRVDLIRSAERIGIPRFRANLILSVTQDDHRRRPERNAAASPGAGPAVAPTPGRSGESAWTIALAILALEVLVIGSVMLAF